jgi:hypothetical protein
MSVKRKVTVPVGKAGMGNLRQEALSNIAFHSPDAAMYPAKKIV